jgi:hypothetical protein
MHRRAGRNDLKETQERVVAMLRSGELRQLTRQAYQELTAVSRSQAAYDLAELVEKGILRQDGAGRATSYRLAREEAHRRRRWTEERIRAELTGFCGGRQAWPSAAEFKRAGRGDLYVAASRYGGIGFWVQELGFSERRLEKGALLRRRLAFGAVAAAVVAAAIAAALAVRHGGAPRRPAAARSAAAPAAPLQRRAARHARPSISSKPKPSQPRTMPRPSSPKPLLTRALTAQRVRAAPTRTSAPPTRTSGAPAPLAAPRASTSPAPLAAP